MPNKKPRQLEPKSVAQLVERWENVVRVLKALTPHERRKHWDMSEIVRKTPCGTVACAVGHAAMDPWFKRRGLKVINIEDLEFGGLVDGVDEFFGSEGAEKIFWDGHNRSVGTVIRECKRHIKWLKSVDKEEALA